MTIRHNIAYCSCGWIGSYEELRARCEYANESPNSYMGRQSSATTREFCPKCNESAQSWFSYEFPSELDWRGFVDLLTC